MSFNQSDIEMALQQGLISEDDAQYLTQHAGGSPLNSAIGLGAGALLGSGAGAYAGRKGGQLLAESLGPAGGAEAKFGAGAAEAMNAPRLDMGQTLGSASAADMTGMALGSAGGGAAGYALGNAMSSGETDQMLQMLMDPNTPPEVKQQILAQLQAMQQGQAPQGQEQGGDQGFDWGQLAAGTAGAVSGAALGSYGGKLLGDSFGPGMVRAAKPGGYPGDESIMRNWGDFLGTANKAGSTPGGYAAGAGLGLIGAGAGGWGGSELAERPDPNVMRFNDPLGGG